MTLNELSNASGLTNEMLNWLLADNKYISATNAMGQLKNKVLYYLMEF